MMVAMLLTGCFGGKMASSASRGGDGHIGELTLLGEYDIHTVVIVVVAAHEIVALREKGEHLFCVVNTLFCIQHACCNGVGLRQVEEISSMSHDDSPFGRSGHSRSYSIRATLRYIALRYIKIYNV